LLTDGEGDLYIGYRVRRPTNPSLALTTILYRE
jgi:hypothetical protein